MSTVPTVPSATHEVFNQSPPFGDFNLYDRDTVLKEALHREGAGAHHARLHAYGETMGSAEALAWAQEANTQLPVLANFDRYGQRIDQVRYTPAYHQLMASTVKVGCHGAPWADTRPGAHTARAGLFYLDAQNELGHNCPISMTYAVVPALRHTPALSASWEPKLVSGVYDPRPVPASEKAGVIMGMAMTEKQGGSDVRANTSTARPLGDGSYSLHGHKWFCSAPMSDAFLMLANTERGLSCFLVPRYRDDGSINGISVMRLKDKLGNRSNASSEIEFSGAIGQLVGPEGRGVPTIIEMTNHTRLDCVIGGAAIMRACLHHAAHHTIHRRAFGKRLIEQPIMRAVLADLSLESEASTTLMMRLARSYDQTDPEAMAFRRIATPIAKYLVCKRAVFFAFEALECQGGPGYVEDFVLARHYREAPCYSIWEGSGNVICLDVLRALRKQPATAGALCAEIGRASGRDSVFDAAFSRWQATLESALDDEMSARRVVEQAAILLQASLLLRVAPSPVAEAFVAARIQERSQTFGALPAGIATEPLLERIGVPL